MACVENSQLLAKGEDFRHQCKARRKKGAILLDYLQCARLPRPAR
jgi:hypothetical protein